MEVLLSSGKRNTRKRIVVVIASLFFGILLFWTLFSNMLIGLTLPRVVTEAPTPGSLDVNFQGTSSLRPVLEVELFNHSGEKPTEILAREGDVVQKGQLLVRYDRTAKEQQLELEQNALQKLKLGSKQLQDDYKLAARGEDVAAIEAARNALESLKLDLSAQEKRIQMLQTELTDRTELRAPFAGRVTSVLAIENIPSNGADIRLLDTERGMQFDIRIPADMAAEWMEGDAIKVRTLGKESRLVEGRITKMEADSGNESNMPEESAAMNIPASEERQAAKEMVQVQIRITDKSLRAGNRVQVELTQSAGGDTLILSRKAVHQDRNGFYVFAVQSRPGPLGNQFYVSKNYVTVIGEDDQSTAIAQEFWLEETEIIVESSEPLEDGQRVRY
ncbi:efflux RND transporter periplasmic adaptor subunit [Cohnella terricola]|uniref:Efflux RND transporter periplasmic adaptor subunit n=1 Tax=Cohnella terricola TaxID=1289167 RepID=A0A559JWL3_9BACL|nr:hypothetical protein [Cohnella terricola]TVY04281.1 hypothetical protein FPZ45_01415 [Cohnella terricola]